MRGISRPVLIALVAVLVVSGVLALLHSPPSKTSTGAWATQAALIAGGGVGFALVCIVDGVLAKAVPQVVVALVVNFFPILVYWKTKRRWVLVVASTLWILVGWWATIGSTF